MKLVEWLGFREPETARRRVELQQLWGEYLEFRSGAFGFSDMVRSKLTELYQDKLQSADLQNEVETGEEMIMLFYFGVWLAKKAKPQITENVPTAGLGVYVPLSEERDDCRFNSFYLQLEPKVEGDQLRVSYRYVVPIKRLLGQGQYCSDHTKKWFGDKTKSVSLYLVDWEVVDILMSGVEEYAHEVYFFNKGEDLQRRMLKCDERIDEQISSVEYHADDLERRALTWQLMILEKYLPSWAKPTRKFINKVKKFREQRRTS